VRGRGWETLADRLADPSWAPAAGPARPHPSAGAAIVGARPVLIAFNAVLGTGDVAIARAVARAVRRSSGGLPAVRAIGVSLETPGSCRRTRRPRAATPPSMHRRRSAANLPRQRITIAEIDVSRERAARSAGLPMRPTGHWRAVVPAVLTAALLTIAPMAHGHHVSTGATRHYYLAVEETTWDYAPSGKSLLGSGPRDGRIPAPWRGNTKWTKVRYVEYTDGSFVTKKPQPDWLGILGPVLRAEVGDTIAVHFLNRAKRNYGIQPHGVKPANNVDFKVGFPPNSHFVYAWKVDEESGPRPGDGSSVSWWYHSPVDERTDINAGLLGPIIVTAHGKARPDATPVDVDRELIVAMMIFDEAKGARRGLMHSINGFIFGNVPPMTARVGERLRWHVLGMGKQQDLHSLEWSSKTEQYRQRKTDVPGAMATTDMVAADGGTWLLRCQVADHFRAGMAATFAIMP
jgi:multicopper oxidase